MLLSFSLIDFYVRPIYVITNSLNAKACGVVVAEEHIFVLRGALRLILGDKTIDVGEKQTVRFRADMPHAYQNLSDSECAIYNMIFYTI